MEPQRCVLLKHGELFLKGQNRPIFEDALLRNLRAVLGRDCAPERVWHRPGVIVVYPGPAVDTTVERLRDVMGISTVQPALRVPKTTEDAVAGALSALRDRFGDTRADTPRTFAIQARRRDKNFPLTSMELAAHVGTEVREATGWTVDLGDPEVTVEVEVDRREVFVSVQRLRGQGGLPVGSSGRALVLLSGGFDSPVAAYRAMRRGLRCEFVHFSGTPYTGPSSTYKAYALVRQLSRYQPDARLWVVPLGQAQRTLAASGPQELRTLAQRRLMVRIGEAVARRLGAEALVTGDSLGQVSSQTLSNLASVEQACTRPLLRPLLAWDKEEIIAEAARIGTAEISRLPDEDCCRLLAPPRPATRSSARRLDRIERRAEVDELVESALEQAREFEVSPGPAPEPAGAACAARA